MKSLSKRFWGFVRRFDRDQRGMEALQVVMITALAAVVGVGIFAAVKYGVDWMNKRFHAVAAEADPSNLPSIQDGSNGDGTASANANANANANTSTNNDTGNNNNNNNNNSGISGSISGSISGGGGQLSGNVNF